MLLAYNQLNCLMDEGVIRNAKRENVNGSSIDIVLGDTIQIESRPKFICPRCGHENHLLTIDTNYPIFCINPLCNYYGNVHNYVGAVDFSKKQPVSMEEVSCKDGYILNPGDVCLAHSVETFHLPMNITAEYTLKSSMARIFLEHLHAGYCDPGWHGSVLTMEFSNMSRYHPILLKAGTKCGQVKFYEHEPVPEDKSYKARGQYNNDTKPTSSKGVK